MSLERAIQYGKEHRKQYNDSRRFDYSCRHGGACDRCRRDRTFTRLRDEARARDELKEAGL
jgi:hypothetical protein